MIRQPIRGHDDEVPKLMSHGSLSLSFYHTSCGFIEGFQEFQRGRQSSRDDMTWVEFPTLAEMEDAAPNSLPFVLNARSDEGYISIC